MSIGHFFNDFTDFLLGKRTFFLYFTQWLDFGENQCFTKNAMSRKFFINFCQHICVEWSLKMIIYNFNMYIMISSWRNAYNLRRTILPCDDDFRPNPLGRVMGLMGVMRGVTFHRVLQHPPCGVFFPRKLGQEDPWCSQNLDLMTLPQNRFFSHLEGR